jgi:glycolate oxidase FAD binding subunit
MDAKAITIEEVQLFVRQSERILPRGGGTKPALSTPPQGERSGIQVLDVSGIAGVSEYEPEEFTFTALAGTRLADVQPLLAEHGQYLPFDPLLPGRGATLGGSVATGSSGPGRYHYGGVRDFLLGVRFVNSTGQVVRAGSKVVKNAAGFDIPKLMVGSLGGLGVLVELIFKVFPRPEACGTLRLECTDLDEALEMMRFLTNLPLDLDAVELQPGEVSSTIFARLGGLAKALPARLERLYSLVGRGEILQGAEEEGIWRQMREMEWVPAGWSLVKVPLTPGRISGFEAALNQRVEDGMQSPILRRYSSAGQVGWLALSEAPMVLDSLLTAQQLSGLVLFGLPERVRLGVWSNTTVGGDFAQCVKLALDPEKRFLEV